MVLSNGLWKRRFGARQDIIGEKLILNGGGVKTIPLPAKSPNLNAFAERWVRSAKQECLSKLMHFEVRRGKILASGPEWPCF